MGRCHSKVIYQKCVFFYKYCKRLLVKRLLVKNKKELLSILYRLRITQIYVENFILQNISTCSYQFQLETYYILLHSKLKIMFYTRWNPNWLEKYTANCLSYLNVNLYLSFLLLNNNSATMNKFREWITIPACFRNGRTSCSTLALNLKDWHFGVIVTRHFRSKSSHLNERVC